MSSNLRNTPVSTLVLITIFTALMALTACHTTTKSRKTSIAPSTDPAAIQLAEAATSISSSLQEITAIEKTAMPAKRKSLVSTSAPHMKNLVSIDWTGPIQPLVEKIAKLSGYKLKVLGNPPSIPTSVSITAKNTPIGDILRDADFQVGEKADVVLNAKRCQIELRYNHA